MWNDSREIYESFKRIITGRFRLRRQSMCSGGRGLNCEFNVALRQRPWTLIVLIHLSASESAWYRQMYTARLGLWQACQRSRSNMQEDKVEHDLLLACCTSKRTNSEPLVWETPFGKRLEARKNLITFDMFEVNRWHRTAKPKLVNTKTRPASTRRSLFRWYRSGGMKFH